MKRIRDPRFVTSEEIMLKTGLSRSSICRFVLACFPEKDRPPPTGSGRKRQSPVRVLNSELPKLLDFISGYKSRRQAGAKTIFKYHPVQEKKLGYRWTDIPPGFHSCQMVQEIAHAAEMTVRNQVKKCFPDKKFDKTRRFLLSSDELEVFLKFLAQNKGKRRPRGPMGPYKKRQRRILLTTKYSDWDSDSPTYGQLSQIESVPIEDYDEDLPLIEGLPPQFQYRTKIRLSELANHFNIDKELLRTVILLCHPNLIPDGPQLREALLA